MAAELDILQVVEKVYVAVVLMVVERANEWVGEKENSAVSKRAAK